MQVARYGNKNGRQAGKINVVVAGTLQVRWQAG